VDLAILDSVPGKAFIVGVIDLSDESPIEDRDTVAARIRSALPHAAAERILVAPDCGMKYLDRATAFAKLCVMVEAAQLVRAEIYDRG